jgi:hypothetical protein
MPVAHKNNNERWTYADYLTWPDDERWEIIDGVAYPWNGTQAISHGPPVSAINWLISGEQTLLVYKPGEDGKYGAAGRYAGDDEVPVPLLGDLVIELAEVFVE